MSTEPEEYTDKQTGMRLTVERAYPYDPDWPHLTVYPPLAECTLTPDVMHEAVQRLVRMAGYDEALHEWVERKP
jgi:hypothetical protein